jgi:hypothetical protein
MKKQAIFKGCKQNFTDSLRSWNGLFVILKNTLGLNGPMGIKSLHSEPIGNNEDAKKFIRYISNRNIFINSKTRRGTYLFTSGTVNFYQNILSCTVILLELKFYSLCDSG